MKYENGDDANFYLQDSLHIYEGKAVQVLDATNTKVFLLAVDQDEDDEPDGVDIEDLDPTPFRVGYFQLGIHRNCRYIERLPARQWRQGLNPNNTRDLSDSGWTFNLNDYKEYELMYADDYPDVYTAKDKAMKYQKEVPFDFDFSIDASGILRYKTSVIGILEGVEAEFNKGMEFMKELFDDTVNKRLGGMA